MQRFIFEKELFAATNFLQAQTLGVVLNLQGQEKESADAIKTRSTLLNGVLDLLRQRALELSFEFGLDEDREGFADFQRMARMAFHLEKLGRTVELFVRSHVGPSAEVELGALTDTEIASLGECVDSWAPLIRDRDKEAAREALLAAQRLEDVLEGVRKRVSRSDDSPAPPVSLLREIVSDTRAMALEVLKAQSEVDFEMAFEDEYPAFEEEEEDEEELPEEEEIPEMDVEAQGESGTEQDTGVENESQTISRAVEEERTETRKEGDGFLVVRGMKGHTYLSVFPGSDEESLEAEKRKAQTWNAVMYGLVPQPLAPGTRPGDIFGEDVFECMSLRRCVEKENASIVTQAASRFTSTLDEVWHKTVRYEKVKTEYSEKLSEAVRGLFDRFPSLERVVEEELLGQGYRFESIWELLEKARSLEPTLAPLKAVYIHGALSLDRVFFDEERDRILLVGVGESRFGDFLQDIQGIVASSDTLIGISRLSRALAREINVSMLSLAERFAREIEDTMFQRRLHLSGAAALLLRLGDLAGVDEVKNQFIRGVKSLLRLFEGGSADSLYPGDISPESGETGGGNDRGHTV